MTNLTPFEIACDVRDVRDDVRHAHDILIDLVRDGCEDATVVALTVTLGAALTLAATLIDRYAA